MHAGLKLAVLVAYACSGINAYASCGGAFCNLNTDWDIQAVSTKVNVRLDLRAEYIDLDQLRHGTHKTEPSGEVGEHDEVRTINRNVLATLDWNINPQWGLTLKLPVVNRAHDHIHNLSAVDHEPESWNFTGVGDLQAIARYGFYREGMSNAGIRFGLKLPTGSINKRNANGELAERTLQSGSGSIDGLVGAYFNQHMGNVGWFAQGMLQTTLHERDDFRPGRKLSADVGLSYNLTPDLSLLLQLNALHKSRDSGFNAEPTDSGGSSLNLSPGLSYRILSGTQVYGFIQKPIYQYVNGNQLTADWSAAVGINTVF